jgi:hypothetical protein
MRLLPFFCRASVHNPLLPMAGPFPKSGNGPYRLLRGLSIKAVECFEKSLQQPEAVALERLKLIAGEVAGTEFAKKNNLKTWEFLNDLRESLPVRTWAEAELEEPDKPNARTRSRVTHLLETSGTTGKPKHIPVTEPWAESVAAAQKLWVLGLVRDDEALSKGYSLANVSAAETAKSARGTPIGANTGRMWLRQPWWVKLRAPVPYRVYCIEDPELRSYVILRWALTRDIRSWTAANPSTLLLYCRKLAHYWEDLVADCQEGTLKRGPAQKLSRLEQFKLGFGAGRKKLLGEPLPAKIWNLRRINCWKGGASRFFLERFLKALGGEVPVREVGITASEGFFAIPVDDGDPVAWVGGQLLELVEESGKACWPWEASVGKEYRLVITTESGLYRYDLEDRVRVTGWLDRLPRLAFVGKTAKMLNATGEKVSEEQLALAIAEVFPESTGASACMGWGEIPWFKVAVEGAEVQGKAEKLDRVLRRLNVEYESKRQTGRLELPELLKLSSGKLAAWKAEKVASGAPEAQVKEPWILAPEAWEKLCQ